MSNHELPIPPAMLLQVLGKTLAEMAATMQGDYADGFTARQFGIATRAIILGHLESFYASDDHFKPDKTTFLAGLNNEKLSCIQTLTPSPETHHDHEPELKSKTPTMNDSKLIH
ncbi:MAG: hypothetical protein V7708_02800 [Oceanicoccus sp.]